MDKIVVGDVLGRVAEGVLDRGVLGSVTEKQPVEVMVEVELFIRLQKLSAGGVEAHDGVLDIAGHHDELAGYLRHLDQAAHMAPVSFLDQVQSNLLRNVACTLRQRHRRLPLFKGLRINCMQVKERHLAHLDVFVASLELHINDYDRGEHRNAYRDRGSGGTQCQWSSAPRRHQSSQLPRMSPSARPAAGSPRTGCRSGTRSSAKVRSTSRLPKLRGGR